MSITPMKAKGVQHLVERAYREGGSYQWLRETVVNAVEADATRVEFSTEWQAVQSQGVHRRIVADNGKGMTPVELKSFFNTFGAGSKTIGPVHENFGIGAKAQVVPDWIEDQGSVILLLGSGYSEDTVIGDPSKGEYAPNRIASYLNERLWEVPPGVTLRTREYWSRNKDEWPIRAAWKQKDNKVNTRLIHGAKNFLTSAQGVEDSGSVFLSDGTRIHWYLWSEVPSSQGHRPSPGYFGILYRGELYDIRRDHHAFRHFGIALKKLRERLVLIAQPREYDDSRQHGAYPRHDRNALLFKSGQESGKAPPLEFWGEEFVKSFPRSLRLELNKMYGDDTQTLDDKRWRKRLQNRFGSRWKIPGLRSSTDPELSGRPGRNRDSLPQAPVRKTRKVVPKKREPEGQLRLGESAKLNAIPSPKLGGLPSFRVVGGEEFDDGILARWVPNDPQHPEGLIFINSDHLVIEELSEYWRGRYPTAPALKWDIANIYGQVAVAKIAHSEQMKQVLSVDKVEQEMRSDLALTMSLLGLYSEDSIIRNFLSGKYGSQKGKGKS